MNEKYIADRLGAIAVIAMNGRWPGAGSPEELWKLLVEQREAITQLSDDELEFDVRKTSAGADHQHVVNARAILDDVDKFDASFFGIYPKEAELMDPQHRLFLECAWETIEQAGYNPETYPGLVGVFAGENQNSYLMNNLCSDRLEAEAYVGGCHISNFQLTIGNGHDFLPTRVAYKLNLKGPAIALQTACSTSLVAINQACVNLQTFQCDMAVAGGVAISFPQKRNYLYDEGGILSGDGHCRAFDAKAVGTVFGSGVGIVALKRLEDALKDGDQIRGVILGSAINNDGNDKIGFAAPGINQQAQVVQLAQEMAGVTPDAISYVETHGTGTPLGDPIEIAALTQAFRSGTDRKQYCAIGSVKSNIGHMDSAAGVTGLIKSILSMENGALPPILHFEEPNPHIDFGNSPFFPLKKLVPWPKGDEMRRAGVSSFGVGGTNAHAILEEAPEIESGSISREVHALVLSARSESALLEMRENLAKHLAENTDVDLADMSFTLQCGRKQFGHRLALSCRTVEEAIEKLRHGDAQSVHVRRTESCNAQVALLFPGQGGQYPGMGRELYEKEEVFRDAVDRCASLLMPLIGEDIRCVLYPTGDDADAHAEKMKQTAFTQPCIFITEYALAKLWMSWGIRPVAVVGHSIGEYVAAVLSDVFSLEVAVRLLAERARLIQSLPGGSMLAVRLPEEEMQEWLSEGVSVAAVNGPSVTVLSGADEAIEGLALRLEKEEVYCKVLATSHGFHSPMMDPILDEFHDFVETHAFSEPRLPWISTLTGKQVTKEDIEDSTYWSRQIRSTVRFSDAIETLLESPETVLLEVGPGRALGNMSLQHPLHKSEQVVVSSLSSGASPEDDYDAVMLALGDLWSGGVDVDWDAFRNGEHRMRVRLPTYPFERKSFWVDPPAQGDSKEVAEAMPSPNRERQTEPEDLTEIFGTNTEDAVFGSSGGMEKALGELIHELSGLDMVAMGSEVTFSEVGIDSLLALRLFSELEKRFGVTLPLATLLEASTIPELAKRIEAGGSNESDRQGLVVEMTNEVADKKLFLIHAAEGGVLFYKDFAEELRSVCSVYGLEAPWLMSEGMVAESMEEVASSYLEMIRKVQPEGPYMLAGFCYGGVVAFEMASQLRAAGDSVDTLVLFDTSNPMNLPVRYGGWERFLLNLELIRAKPLAEQFSIIAGRAFGKFGANKNKIMAKIRYRRSKVEECITGVESVDRKVADMHEFHERLFFEYKPKSYDGNMVLVEGIDREPMYDYPENLGWNPVIKGELHDYRLQVEHMSMLLYPSAVEVAKIVANEISCRE